MDDTAILHSGATISCKRVLQDSFTFYGAMSNTGSRFQLHYLCANLTFPRVYLMDASQAPDADGSECAPCFASKLIEATSEA
jgi:hypothetical protein